MSTPGTLSKPPLKTRLLLTLAIWAGTAYVWLLRLTCRIRVVEGRQHLDQALTAGVVLPCSWHQQILTGGLFLRDLLPRGLKTGFLISPSREGEFITRVVENHGPKVMRGSSSRTGTQAVKTTLRAIRDGISPTFFADGPRGPARQFKPGALTIARRTGTPVLFVGSAASRYWQIGSWDQTCLPKPFARINIALGELWHLPKNGEQDTGQLVREAEQTINTLTEHARASLAGDDG